jgi:hypothetical protein
MLKIFLWKNGRWSIDAIASSIDLSNSETHAAIKRSGKAGVFDALTERPRRAALEEFIIHGVKYAFPAEIGAKVRGLPTAHSAPPLSSLIVSNKEDVLVWPTPEGKVQGLNVSPLYPCVPVAAKNDPKLYQFLALIDALRIGRPREQKCAIDEIIKRLRAPNEIE